MAQVACRECGASRSDRVPSCPQSGIPLRGCAISTVPSHGGLTDTAINSADSSGPLFEGYSLLIGVETEVIGVQQLGLKVFCSTADFLRVYDVGGLLKQALNWQVCRDGLGSNKFQILLLSG